MRIALVALAVCTAGGCFCLESDGFDDFSDDSPDADADTDGDTDADSDGDTDEGFYCESPTGTRDCASIVDECGRGCGTDRSCAQGCLDEAADLPTCAEALDVMECLVSEGEAGGGCVDECADYESDECGTCLAAQCTDWGSCVDGGYDGY